MPYMAIQRGVDGLWHSQSPKLPDGCGTQRVEPTQLIGSEDVATMPDPKPHERCPVCFPIQYKGGFVSPDMITDLISLGFEEGKLSAYPGVAWANRRSICMTQVKVVVAGPDLREDDPFVYDARKKRWDLGEFHRWWERATIMEREVLPALRPLDQPALLKARVEAYWALREQGFDHDEALAEAKKIKHVST